MEPAQSVRQHSLRHANLALVLRTICGSPAALSRADVASRTGMTRATAARLVDELVAARLVDEVARTVTPTRGRPATPLRPGAGVAALGLQVDVTFLAARVVNLRGEVVKERVEVVDNVERDAAVTLARLRRLAGQVHAALPEGTSVRAAGLALPGLVDIDRRILLRAPNLGWHDVRVSSVLGLPLRLGNEADLAARTVAEPAPGRRGPLQDFLYLTGQVGIGGSAVLGGRPMRGSHGWSGEIGHVCVDPRGPRCGCGSSGCLEQYAGQQALLSSAGMSSAGRVEDVFRCAELGDERANRAVTTALEALAVAVASVINVLDISTVVLSGHLSLFVDRLQRRLSDRVLSSAWAQPEVIAAPAAVAPAATGAALAALAEILDQPTQWMTGAA